MKFAIKNPIKYMRSPEFFWIFSVYANTYLVANVCDSLYHAYSLSNKSFVRWLSTTVSNSALTVLKDRAFAKLFGAGLSGSVPLGSYAAWLTRDGISLFAFLTLPPMIAPF